MAKTSTLLMGRNHSSSPRNRTTGTLLSTGRSNGINTSTAISTANAVFCVQVGSSCVS